MRITRTWVLIAVALAGCGKSKGNGGPCPSSFLDFKDAASADPKTCTCAASPSGAVYGVDVYTQDSSLCAAAVHAGAIPATGGDVTVKSAPGCASYTGSTRNGVTTSGWAKYPGSFFFVGKGEGKCGDGSAAAADPTPTAPTAPPVVTKHGNGTCVEGEFTDKTKTFCIKLPAGFKLTSEKVDDLEGATGKVKQSNFSFEKEGEYGTRMRIYSRPDPSNGTDYLTAIGNMETDVKSYKLDSTGDMPNTGHGKWWLYMRDAKSGGMHAYLGGTKVLVSIEAEEFEKPIAADIVAAVKAAYLP